MTSPAAGLPTTAGRHRAVAVVVDHHLRTVAQAGAAQHLLQRRRIGQRVAPRRTGRARELRVEVDEHRAGDVGSVVIGPAGRATEPPPDVEDDGECGPRGAAERRLQSGRRDDRSRKCRHVPILHGMATPRRGVDR